MVFPTGLLPKMSFNTNSISSYTTVLVLLFVVLTKSVLVEGEGADESDAEHGGHAAHAVIYPSFMLTLGVIIYYTLSRFLHFLPYTAVMFLFGVIMGLVSASEKLLIPDKPIYYMHDALFAWKAIDSEVLLLVFLPGLIFRDALAQNSYMFAMGFVQLLIFAFPLVLAGTFLTALVGYYIFPYDWSFFLCLTFGAIMSATDPVAVSALLEEVGAPPRLTTHIAGESLLNDGAAIVFFFIFKDIFLSELGIEGLGKEIDFAEGVKLFVQKAIGGCAFGLLAGGAMIFVMSMLNHRFSREENIVQVTALIGMVYLNYFIADVSLRTSGVIATLAAGLCVTAFGRGVINDIHLMDDFLKITEHILNTILFSLGGLVWGFTIYDNHIKEFTRGIDWGYLLILYVLLHVIRAIGFIAVYPITSRIGLKTDWKETTFQIYGGLRGAVGIALAIYLDNELVNYTGNDDYDVATEEEDVAQVYFMVGGIAFLTLFINGTTAGPFLKWLGLADNTETRTKIIHAKECHIRALSINTCVRLLVHTRFKSIDFSFVQRHIPFLSDLKLEELVEATKKLKETTEKTSYRHPYLYNVLILLEGGNDLTSEQEEILNPPAPTKQRRMLHRSTSLLNTMKGEPMSSKEMRLLFLSILRSQYDHLIGEGIIGSEDGQTVALLQSLELAKNEVNCDGILNDLHHALALFKIARKYYRIQDKIIGLFPSCGKHRDEHKTVGSMIKLKFGFINAHERTQKVFQAELGDADNELSEGGKIVLAESLEQVESVRKDLENDDFREIITTISTRSFCNIVLTQAIEHVEEVVKGGFLKESEAEHIIENLSHHQKTVLHAKVLV